MSGIKPHEDAAVLKKGHQNSQLFIGIPVLLCNFQMGGLASISVLTNVFLLDGCYNILNAMCIFCPMGS